MVHIHNGILFHSKEKCCREICREKKKRMELENILLSSLRVWNTNVICSLSCVDPSFYFAFVWVCMGAHVYAIDPRCHYSDTVVLAFWDCFHWPGASPSRVGLLSHKTQRGTCPFLPIQPKDYNHTTRTWLFYISSGGQSQDLMLMQQALSQ